MAIRNRMNFVDAVAQYAPSVSKARTLITKIGTVTTLGPVGYITVRVSNQDTVCNYLKGDTYVVGDQVLVLVDGDLWVVIGAFAASSGGV